MIYNHSKNSGFKKKFITRTELSFEIRSRKSTSNNITNCYVELESINGKIYSIKEP